MATLGDAKLPKAIPAHLSLLAIYNPTLGTTDETLREQIVFYYSHDVKRNRRKGSASEELGSGDEKDENEKLRQIGLAQGMVSFARRVDIDRKGVALTYLEPFQMKCLLIRLIQKRLVS
jgi:hypothetical protein